MSLEEELKLIENAQSNIQSFAALYDIYFPKIYSYCLNRLCNKENAEDVTSQVFLKSIEIVKSFDTKRSIRLGPWLYAIAHNLIIDTIRKNSHIVIDEKAFPMSSPKIFNSDTSSLGLLIHQVLCAQEHMTIGVLK